MVVRVMCQGAAQMNAVPGCSLSCGLRSTPALARAIRVLARTCLGLPLIASAQESPRIRFDRMAWDFGRISWSDRVAGVFTVTNDGAAALRIDPLESTCGCTWSGLKRNCLQPGEVAQLAFTLHLGESASAVKRYILVRSNDPRSPTSRLTVKADYAPLHEIAPGTLAPVLPWGLSATSLCTAIRRTDGRPLSPLVFKTTRPWITAWMEPGPGANDSTGRIFVAVQRDGAPRRFHEQVHVLAPGGGDGHIRDIYLYGRILGEVSVTPEALYWNVRRPDPGGTDRADAPPARRVAIVPASGGGLAIRNPTSTVDGIHLDLTSSDGGARHELTATLSRVPERTVSGLISFGTSSTSQPRIDLPVIINVHGP